MDKQNQLRKEAAIKKKEEAKKLAAAEGGPKLDKMKTKLDEGKKMGLGADAKEGGAQDVSEHFVDDSFDKVIDKIKELSEESHMRNVNA